MIYLILLLVFVSVSAFIFGIWAHLGNQMELTRLRLERLVAYHTGPGPGGSPDLRPQRRRALASFTERVSGFFAGMIRKALKNFPGRSLNLKGSPLRLKLSLGVVVALAVLPLSHYSGLRPPQVVVLVVSGFTAGLLLPDAITSHRKRARERAIQKALPDMLDLLTMSVEAGLGFDRALSKVIESKKGPLAEEFSVVLQEIRVGRPRREALRDLSERLKLPEVSRLIGAILQAEQLGTGMAKTLRVQAEQLRLARRQRAEEAAMKAPIKILFPLVLFVFPALFVVLLGPAIIQMVIMFMKTGG